MKGLCRKQHNNLWLEYFEVAFQLLFFFLILYVNSPCADSLLVMQHQKIPADWRTLPALCFLPGQGEGVIVVL